MLNISSCIGISLLKYLITSSCSSVRLALCINSSSNVQIFVKINIGVFCRSLSKNPSSINIMHFTGGPRLVILISCAGNPQLLKENGSLLL